ncbi:Aste57867_13895 [Aphanomyces stellatus]|uniref:Aste57867_13895 protein n=1 Tax=Aphanomyces stellatus TaxID=120398 RepID=A0A485L079_9STRA|nr:hypothetical protein As57867_013844 [Aphanomyces stellatus]VFT90726.1 Aste57867_13895 [Aphanomyces stellatus]
MQVLVGLFLSATAASAASSTPCKGVANTTVDALASSCAAANGAAAVVSSLAMYIDFLDKYPVVACDDSSCTSLAQALKALKCSDPIVCSSLPLDTSATAKPKGSNGTKSNATAPSGGRNPTNSSSLAGTNTSDVLGQSSTTTAPVTTAAPPATSSSAGIEWTCVTALLAMLVAVSSV